MKSLLVLPASFAILAVTACTQTSTETTRTTTSQTTVDHNKITGNRSADPLGNYSDESVSSLTNNSGIANPSRMAAPSVSTPMAGQR